MKEIGQQQQQIGQQQQQIEQLNVALENQALVNIQPSGLSTDDVANEIEIRNESQVKIYQKPKLNESEPIH